jgi:hypothetical protein
VITQSDVQIEGTGAGEDLTVSTRVQLPTPPALEIPDGFSAELWAHSLSATVEEGVSDFGFVRQLTLVVSTPEPSDLGPQTVVHYERREGEPAATTLTVLSESELDILRLWATADPVYDLTLSGTLPVHDWSLSLSLTFEGSLSVGLGAQL